jgi:hypothetical protein
VVDETKPRTIIHRRGELYTAMAVSISRKPMPVSSWWMQGAILTYLFGFLILGMLAYFTYSAAPLPSRALITC